MSSGNGAARPEEQSAAGPGGAPLGDVTDSSTGDPANGEDTGSDPAASAIGDGLPQRRRKPGVEYRPV
jgi:hypothetical protein